MRVVRGLNHSKIIVHTRNGGLAQLARALAYRVALQIVHVGEDEVEG